MNRQSVNAAASAMLVMSAAAVATESGCPRDPAAEAIESRRLAFNDAIQQADLASVADVLAEDVVLVAGTNSDLFLDKASQVAVWRSDFAKGPNRLVYVRTPDCIRLSPLAPMALENGRWRGENEAGDYAAGSYFAKWRQIDGSWRLEAEIFMTEACGGAACPENADRSAGD